VDGIETIMQGLLGNASTEEDVTQPQGKAIIQLIEVEDGKCMLAFLLFISS
jgi:hypothetical protein